MLDSTARVIEVQLLVREVAGLVELDHDPASIARALATLPAAPTLLVNNAGITRDRTLAKMSDEEWRAVIDVNLTGAFNMLRALAPGMIAASHGRVVNITSINGLRGKFGQVNYTAAKAGLIGLTKTASGEVARQGIRVNAVCPGPIDTRMIHDLEAQLNPSNPGKVTARYQSSIPIGRYGTAEEVANTVLFLCSDLAGNITGAHYVVDGGRTATPGAVTSMNED